MIEHGAFYKSIYDCEGIKSCRAHGKDNEEHNQDSSHKHQDGRHSHSNGIHSHGHHNDQRIDAAPLLNLPALKLPKPKEHAQAQYNSDDRPSHGDHSHGKRKNDKHAEDLTTAAAHAKADQQYQEYQHYQQMQAEVRLSQNRQQQGPQHQYQQLLPSKRPVRPVRLAPAPTATAAK
ncbi:MAG: hypothetical protein LQ340_001511 [Diploschistes diacapsis]|nr:MAG: hypothetical protein LQ340_001511 [Diploschistes diacapsis]